ncbi:MULTISPECIES: amino acid adenylation [Vibrio harveyi group]|uniref:amino acid adenylation n=1 Tax=Vibrio harveyi group TaxID=717610 RepID=UPI001120E8D5|nr:amino acid adenylation [Vibrio parahaemolyticus]MDF4269654.1 amino acid adenylation [Vibrio parahaemolyticus]MDF4274968.1 amino acid adenylation [Vibrio parahaemolyticus]MDF4299582.1 amino acid adenylation [Vibrio parahaemolyticus]TNZ88819.1 amino acid adenylation [Vibrio parahaemolyticus]HCE5206316.1 amino acid adenylation [Vibrio parahaemolyticus]
MQLQLSATNALNKWLKADFPRLPVEEGKQAGVNKLSSDAATKSWQVHLIENRYQSSEKTLIVCEANSRFTYFIPLNRMIFSPDELAERLKIEWQFAFVEALETYALESNGLISHYDIATLLSKLNDIQFSTKWIKNTDPSVNGHIADAAQWVTQTLEERNLARLSQPLAFEISSYINCQTKSIKVNNKKQRFIPIERLLEYVQQITETTPPSVDMSNVVPFRR